MILFYFLHIRKELELQE